MSTTNLEKATTNGTLNTGSRSTGGLTAFRRAAAPAAVRVALNKLLPLAFELSWQQSASDAIDAKAASPDVAPRLGGLVGAGLENSADGRGVFKTYQHGWVMWRHDLGALAVYGAIGARWNEIGGTTSGYGWPVTDELATPRGPGRYNHFEGGSIYWSPNTGARLIYGAIRDLWAAMAWEQGPLGLPTTDEEDVPGVAGARRNHFEGGVITWTPWSGARVTSLNVPAEAPPGGLTIQTVGSGGNPAPAPQVQRHIIATAHIAITDHETFGSNEHGRADRRDERWIDSWDPQGVMTLVGVAGGEVRVEVVADAAVRPDGSVRVGVNVKLFEGTSETTDDLDGVRSTSQVVPRDQVVQIPINIRNDDEGGDHAEISLVISNSST
ncbi:LGFP repeat protein [Kribbella flavida DSM 17836]|uniref:LGFP repeat protein n=1 Tax=Kribbella flavida (strain DSM 17836 / JCM 10339 / NBRC 14399) TaxID=479435 RepID=D2PTU6_KRIFD|nr:LGFP repeat-containing protein [Kribbella flavida]ADB33229.1 LGFP repeat protein [Kribbella flavida DSM 17836]